jgi:hypothetical protein
VRPREPASISTSGPRDTGGRRSRACGNARRRCVLGGGASSAAVRRPARLGRFEANCSTRSKVAFPSGPPEPESPRRRRVGTATSQMKFESGPSKTLLSHHRSRMSRLVTRKYDAPTFPDAPRRPSGAAAHPAHLGAAPLDGVRSVVHVTPPARETERGVARRSDRRGRNGSPRPVAVAAASNRRSPGRNVHSRRHGAAPDSVPAECRWTGLNGNDNQGAPR